MDDEKKIADVTHTVQKTFGEVAHFAIFRYQGNEYRKLGKQTAVRLGKPLRGYTGSRDAVQFDTDQVVDD